MCWSTFEVAHHYVFATLCPALSISASCSAIAMSQVTQTTPLIPSREQRMQPGSISDFETEKAKMVRSKQPLVYALMALCSALVFLGLIAYWCGSLLGGYSWTDSSTMFNLHPLLMSIGFVILPGLSLSLFQLIQPPLEKRQPVKLTHAAIHALGFGCSIVGLIVVFRSKNRSNARHLWSFHGWMGLFLSVLFPLLWVVAFLSFLFPGARAALRAKIMVWHKFLGLSTFVAACIVSLLGITEKAIFERQRIGARSTNTANAASVFLTLFAVLTVYFLQISHRLGDQPVVLQNE